MIPDKKESINGKNGAALSDNPRKNDKNTLAIAENSVNQNQTRTDNITPNKEDEVVVLNELKGDKTVADTETRQDVIP